MKVIEKYNQAKKDLEYLETVCLDYDAVEIEACTFALMADPTKRRAGDMYEYAINFWFDENGKKCNQEPKVKEIAKRWLDSYIYSYYFDED